MCLLLSVTVNGQTASTTGVPAKQYNEIGSNVEYLAARDSIEILAYELYLIYQRYPTLSYQPETDALGNVTGISVSGVNSLSVADQVASHLMKIETLGKAIRSVDKSYLPPAAIGETTGGLSEKEARRYVPTPKLPKEKPLLNAASPVAL
jgi:hypothetical protein